MKTLLVTGATGFIGHHLLPRLLEEGWVVKAAVRNRESAERLPAGLPQGANLVPVITGDLDGETDWREALKGADAVIHLAARAHRIHEDPLSSEAAFMTVNAHGTANLADHALAAAVGHFVFVSSVGVVTSLSEAPVTERTPCRPDTPYGKSKLRAEEVLISKAGRGGMAWTILRPCLVYGPGNPGNMERFIGLVRSGLPLPFGRVRNRRSLLYVGNLVDAMSAVLVHPGAKNEVFLVSDDEAVSTPELARMIARHLGRPCILLPVFPWLLRAVARCGDFLQFLTGKRLPLSTSSLERLIGSLPVDSSHLKETLNWSPRYSCSEGIRRTLRVP